MATRDTFQNISTLKQIVKRKILNNQSIVNLICNQGNNIDKFEDVQTGFNSPAKQFVRTYPYVPETIEKQSVFITMQSGITDTNNFSVRDVVLTVYIFAHEGLMELLQGARTDIISGYLDNEINGFGEIGIGRLQLKESSEFVPIQDYYGQALIYTLQDYNRIGAKV